MEPGNETQTNNTVWSSEMPHLHSTSSTTMSTPTNSTASNITMDSNVTTVSPRYDLPAAEYFKFVKNIFC